MSLEARAGEVVALVGRNGAGKSTLLRILATTLLPDGGSAQVAGLDVLRRPREVRDRIGLCLADDRGWYYQLSGRRNLEFFAGLHGLRGGAKRERCDDLLATLELSAAADRAYSTYSSGMRLRLSLARALLREPPVLLLDEATRSLDAEATADFRGLIRQMASDRSIVVLEVTHDLEHAACADQVVVLAAGRVAARLREPLDVRQVQSALHAA